MAYEKAREQIKELKAFLDSKSPEELAQFRAEGKELMYKLRPYLRAVDEMQSSTGPEKP